MDQGLLRENTAEFIRRAPVEITLRRSSRVDDGAGGWKWGAEQSIAAQTFRKSPTGSSVMLSRTTMNGDTVVVDSLLIGEHDADIRRFDKFTLEGEEYEVIGVTSMRWSVHAEVHHLG